MTQHIGIIGCGKQAPKHIGGLRANSPDVLISVTDTNPEAAIALGKSHSVNIIEDLDQLIADETIQAVIVATPTPSHPEIIKAALLGGKHVFCEKPLSNSKKEAVELQNIVRETRKFVQIGYVYRQVPAYQTCHNILNDRSKPLGDIVSAMFRIGGRGSQGLWKHRTDMGGGAVNEMLVHMVDLAMWFFGPLENIEWHERALMRPKRVINGTEYDVDAEDFVVLTAQSETGVRLLFQADLLTPAFRQYAEIQGSNGSFIGSIQKEIPSYLYLLEPVADYPAGRIDLSYSQINLFNEQMKSFLENTERGTSIDTATIQDSIQLFDLLDST